MNLLMNLFKRSAGGVFASESLIGHLSRGGAGIALVVWAIRHQDNTVLALLAALGTLIAFRGCPLCWTIGLIETIGQKSRKLFRSEAERHG